MKHKCENVIEWYWNIIQWYWIENVINVCLLLTMTETGSRKYLFCSTTDCSFVFFSPLALSPTLLLFTLVPGQLLLWRQCSSHLLSTYGTNTVASKVLVFAAQSRVGYYVESEVENCKMIKPVFVSPSRTNYRIIRSISIIHLCINLLIYSSEKLFPLHILPPRLKYNSWILRIRKIEKAKKAGSGENYFIFLFFLHFIII